MLRLMLKVYPKLIVVLIVVWLAPPGTAGGQVQVIEGRQPFMQEYLIPAAPLNIVTEAPGRVWFTMPERNAIGSLVVTDTVSFTEYPLPSAESEPYDLIYVDGVIWFTQRLGNRIGRLDIATGTFQEFAVPTANSEPTGIAVAPDGSIWFAQRNGNRLARLRVGPVPTRGSSGVSPNENLQFVTFAPILMATIVTIEEFVYDTPGAHFEGIAVANNEAIWATAPNLNQVVYLDLRFGAPSFRFAFTNPHPRPMGIVLDPTGNPWVAPAGSDYIIRYAPGTLSLWRPYPLGTPNSELAAITLRANGPYWELWFTERGAGRAGQLRVRTTSSLVSLREAVLPEEDAGPVGIAVDAEGQVWIADSQSRTIVLWSAPYFLFTHFPLVHPQ
jgi:virginiamycin B lyase